MGRGGTKIFLSRWGKEIRKGMIDHDTNVEEVAEKFGVSNTYINMMIRGDQYDEDLVRKMSELFDVTVPAGPAFTKCRKVKKDITAGKSL